MKILNVKYGVLVQIQIPKNTGGNCQNIRYICLRREYLSHPQRTTYKPRAAVYQIPSTYHE